MPQVAEPGGEFLDMWGALELWLRHHFTNKLFRCRHSGSNLHLRRFLCIVDYYDRGSSSCQETHKSNGREDLPPQRYRAPAGKRPGSP
jgi:hypothetical protein